MKKILFPTDFSAVANNALTFAVEVAGVMDAKIDLVHVYSLPFANSAKVPEKAAQKMLDEKKAEVRINLMDFAKDVDKNLLGSYQEIYGLFTAVEITELAEKGNYDLVILGTKGEHSQTEKYIGTVTTHVMMKARCPVMAIPEHATYKGINNIAYATELRPNDNHAVEQLVVLAGLIGANIQFVHINNSEKKENIEELVKFEDYPLGFTSFSVVYNNSTIEGLNQFIAEKDIDALALFIPKRRLWERLFHSSFTKKMSFQASIPLLVFHQ